MFKRILGLSTVGLLVSALVACNTSVEADNAPSTPTDSTATPSAPTELVDASEGRDLSQLFSRVWRLTDDPASNGIMVFLPNGTVLRAFCGEGYVIETWTIDKESPQILELMEGGSTSVAASIEELSDTTLKLRDTEGLDQVTTLTAVQEEFACPQ